MKNERRNAGSTLPRGNAHNGEHKLQLRFARDDGEFSLAAPINFNHSCSDVKHMIYHDFHSVLYYFSE